MVYTPPPGFVEQTQQPQSRYDWKREATHFGGRHQHHQVPYDFIGKRKWKRCNPLGKILFFAFLYRFFPCFATFVTIATIIKLATRSPPHARFAIPALFIAGSMFLPGFRMILAIVFHIIFHIIGYIVLGVAFFLGAAFLGGFLTEATITSLRVFAPRSKNWKRWNHFRNRFSKRIFSPQHPPHHYPRHPPHHPPHSPPYSPPHAHNEQYGHWKHE